MNKDTDNKYSWNDVVKVKNSAPEYFHPGEIASICGLEKVKFQDVAQEYHTMIGKWIYTIEFKDGSDITIPEDYLELLRRADN